MAYSSINKAQELARQARQARLGNKGMAAKPQTTAPASAAPVQDLSQLGTSIPLAVAPADALSATDKENLKERYKTSGTYTTAQGSNISMDTTVADANNTGAVGTKPITYTPQELEQAKWSNLAKNAPQAMQELISGMPAAQELSKGLGLDNLGRQNEGMSNSATKSLSQAEGLSQGLTAPQLAAQRSQAMETISKSSQGASRRLAAVQASQGIKGGVAVGQQQALLAQNVGARANLERDLLAGNFDAMLRGNQQYMSQSAVTDQNRTDAQKFNIAQATKEKMLPLQISGGASAAAAAERGAVINANAASQGTGGGGISVICTELNAQGLFDADLYDADSLFGELLPNNVLRGYQFLAQPAVKLMRVSKLFTQFINLFARPWSKHMGYEMGVVDKPNKFGKIILAIGMPICNMVGKLIK